MNIQSFAPARRQSFGKVLKKAQKKLAVQIPAAVPAPLPVFQAAMYGPDGMVLTRAEREYLQEASR